MVHCAGVSLQKYGLQSKGTNYLEDLLGEKIFPHQGASSRLDIVQEGHFAARSLDVSFPNLESSLTMAPGEIFHVYLTKSLCLRCKGRAWNNITFLIDRLVVRIGA